MLELVERLRAADALDDLDVAFAGLTVRLASAAASPELALGAALVSRRVGDGEVCLDLVRQAGGPLAEAVRERAPALGTWTAALRSAGVVGAPDDVVARPLVLDSRGRLYLWRYWDYERRVASALRTRAATEADDVDEALLRRDLDALVPRDGTLPSDEPDWQRLAAVTAVLRRLCVISGGPGTGKTHTVTAVLALLASQAAASGRPLRVGLAAPTGKAAARMQDAVRAARQRGLPAAVVERMPDTASTVHRLLGSRRGSASFRYHRDEPLPLDVVVVDEASMIDVALMAKLVDALPPAARLVLLGDRDQLASIEAGAVLGDICADAPGFSRDVAVRLADLTGGDTVPAGDGPTTSALRDAVVLLRRSRRFDADSGIGALAAAVNAGDAAGALAVLTTGRYRDVGFTAVGSADATRSRLAAVVVDVFDAYAAAVRTGDPAAAFAGLRRLALLCAHRSGPGGVDSVGAAVERALHAGRLLDVRGTWYAGRPVMVTRNDYALRLFNGDVGIVLPDADDPARRRVWFEAPGGGHRAVSPARLPEHETVWAMTVHKSQGSEFERVVVVLPPEPSRVCTRELLYTAITRARDRVDVWGSEAVLGASIARRIERSSGLRDALWGDRPARHPSGGDHR